MRGLGEKTMIRTIGGKRRIFTAVLGMLLICLIIAGGMRVSAATGPLVTLEQSMDITIIVGYDTEKPAVVFVAPNNKRYEKPEDFDGITEGDKATYYNISNASSGDWTVEYEKGRNKEITIDVVPWHKNISIESFSFTTSPAEDRPLQNINGKLLASYENGRFNYIVSAVVTGADGAIENCIELYNGSARGGDESEFSVYPEVLPDGEYKLQLEVYGEDSTGVEVHDSVISDASFTITGNTSQGEESCLKIYCDITDSTIDIDFDASSQEIRTDEYALIVFRNATGERISEMLYDQGSFSDHVIFDPADGDITIQINARDRDKGYISWSRTFKPEMPMSLEIETPEMTNDQNAVIRFDAGSETYQGRIIVGDTSNELMFTGSNTAQVSLESMETSELIVEIDAGNITYREKKVISVDTLPPYIDIYGAAGDMVTSEDKVRFAGKTNAVSLTCNDVPVQCEDSGAFSFTADMDEDEKDFCFEASDNAGNVTVRNIHMTKKGVAAEDKTVKKEKKGKWPLIITLIISFLMALFTAVLSSVLLKRAEKKGRKRGTVRTVLCSFTISLICCFTGAGVWQLLMHFNASKKLSGSSLVSLLKDSPISAVAEKIDERQEYLFSSFISFGIAAALLIVLVVCLIVNRKLRRRKNG